MSHMHRLLGLAAATIVCVAAPRPAQAAATCYRLPFSNPNIADGWGSMKGRTSPHRGVDFPQPAGTSIPAVADGKVRLKTLSGCLGNVVVIEHADGMFSGYSHMQSASPLGIGASVDKGQIIGKVGATGSCARGAHLHLTMAPTVGGYGSGTTVDPYKYIEAHKTCNKAPTGAFDVADCDSLAGWGQDEDEPTKTIDVHLYIDGPAGDKKAYGMAVHANLKRDDLCKPLGSCNHAFATHAPFSFFDAASHDIYAYAIDSAGGANTLLGKKSFKCDKPAIPMLPDGVVRRHIANPDVLTAWKFPTVDIATVSDATLDAIPNGPDLTATPALVTTADKVYLHEYDTVRPIASSVLTTWSLDAKDAKAMKATDLAAALPGADWLASPFLAKGKAGDVYLIDSPPALWAELVDDDVPANMAPGATADVTLTFRNRGSLTWKEGDITVAPTPRDMKSSFCDPTWPSCTRAAKIPGTTATNAEAEVHVTLHAPAEEGTIVACFGLVRDTHWFSDKGANGPEEDDICRTITVAKTVGGSDFGDETAEPDDPTVKGGCACQTSGSSQMPALPYVMGIGAVVGLAFARRRRTFH